MTRHPRGDLSGGAGANLLVFQDGAAYLGEPGRGVQAGIVLDNLIASGDLPVRHCPCLVFPLPSVAKTLPLPCVSTLPLPCVSTTFVAQTVPFLAVL